MSEDTVILNKKNRPVDVLFLISSLGGGGAERATVNMASYWVEQNLSVKVVTLSGLQDDFYQLNPKIVRVPLDLSVESESPVGALMSNFTRIRVIRSLLRKSEPSVAIGFMTTSSVLLALASIGLGVKVILAERNYPPAENTGFHWRILRKYTYWFASAVVAQTNQSKKWLQKNTFSREVEVIPNFVQWPIENSAPVVVPSQVLESNDPVLLAIGRLEKQKGFDVLLEAFAKLPLRLSHWKLVILGEGGEHQSLSRFVNDEGLNGRVLLVGRVGNISDWYKRCDVFVLSSRYEGFPNVLLEAMAEGCAALAVNCDTGPRDVIETEVNGVLIKKDDVAGMSSNITRLMESSELRDKLAANAIRVRETYDQSNIMAEWARICGLAPIIQSNSTKRI